MAETASPETADAFSASLDHPRNEQPASQGLENGQAADDGIKDSSSELSELDFPLNGIEDFEDSLFLQSSPLQPSPGDDGPPTKKRRLHESTPPPSENRPKPKLESPPWRKPGADGPTSYTEDGRRKSGRINTIPLEHHPPSDKRLTRGTRHAAHVKSPSKANNASTNGHTPTMLRSASTSSKVPARHNAPRPTSSKGPQVPKPVGRTTNYRFAPKQASPPPQPTRQSSRARKPRTSLDSDVPTPTKNDRAYSQDSPSRPSRIRLRIRGSSTLIHPGQVSKRAKLGPTFEEYWERAGEIPLEDGGYMAEDEVYTPQMAKRDAQSVLAIEQAVEPGGVLSSERCSAFVPDTELEPPRQWARWDHLARHAVHFRKLMVAEEQRHRSQAKKLAEACREAWLRRQPKTAEELEAEARNAWAARYRVVVKAMFGTWENVRTEINRQRLQEWEAEEQRRVKAALNKAVNLSELRLQAQRGQFDSDADEEDLSAAEGTDSSLHSASDSDAEMDEDRTSNDGSDGDDVMSSDEDGDEAVEDHTGDAADADLTQDELRAKYANLPDVPLLSNDEASQPASGDDATNESSDESIDMDDDLGSTEEEDSAADDDDGTDSDSDGDAISDEDAPNGLLGLFFGKSELQDMQNQAHEGDGSAEDETASGIEVLPPGKHAGLPLLPWDPARRDGSDVYSPSPAQFDDDDEPDLVKIPSTAAPSAVPSVAGHHAESPPAEQNTEDSAESQVRPLANGTHTPSGLDSRHSSPAAPGIQTIQKAESDRECGHAQAYAESGMDLDTPSPATQTAPKPPSPDTDVVTGPATSGRSRSPTTADTKPTDMDEPSSPTPENKTIPSRAASPQLGWTPKTEIPFLLRGTLREYQHYGLDWLAGLYANGTNGILADEMGLGKTIQTIALLAHLACNHEVWGPHLVIVPTSVMLNWEMEFKKWCPGFKILSYYGTQEERKRKRSGWNNDEMWNVCITSYQLVLQDQQVFKRRRWHYMILDEAHNIKNFKSQRWQTLLGFNTQARLLLTGTPLQNNLTELWSLLFFLMPSENGVGGFADLQEFHDWFHKPESQILESGRETMDDEARAIISKLHKVLRPYLLRRLKADVEKQMPAKHEHVEFCRLSKRQRELYDGFLARGDTRETLASGNYMSIINCLMQLRKVCNHPDLFVDRPITTSLRMQRSVVVEYDATAQLLQRTMLKPRLMDSVDLGVINLIPTRHEGMSGSIAERISQLSLHRVLMDLREAQNGRAQLGRTYLDPSTSESNLMYLESLGRWRRFEELQHGVYLNALRGQRRPLYGKRLVDFLTLGLDLYPHKPRPRIPRQILNWFSEDSGFLRNTIRTMDDRAASMEMTVSKFAFATPSVVTGDMHELLLGKRGVDAFQETDLKLSAPVRWAPFMKKERPHDPWHEARMRLSIQFPDKRLLQYDCGKLQALDKLLRKLQSGGHRALIFTQMTKVLDILERFLNIHGHKYLRLDGATKVEQRQILTDRFNHDTRILCFILSTRSGGLGINLTGADTVIFYDQDWNPAMDKQCQDRCHRIGQTRDVHIYRLVSEHTIEANILRKASQKQMLDDIVIQEGEFNTEYFKKMSVRDAVGEDADLVNDGMAAANAAMDRLLGGVENSEPRGAGKVFEQAEDKEDVVAAKAAEREIQADDADFQEKAGSGPGSGASSTRQGTPRDETFADATGPGPSGLGRFSESVAPGEDVEEAVEIELNAWGDRIRTVDDYMLQLMRYQLQGTPLDLPKDKKKSKRRGGKDTRKR